MTVPPRRQDFEKIDQYPVDDKVIQADRHSEIPVVVGYMFRSHWASNIPTTSGVVVVFAQFEDLRTRKSCISTREEENTQERDRYTEGTVGRERGSGHERRRV